MRFTEWIKTTAFVLALGSASIAFGVGEEAPKPVDAPVVDAVAAPKPVDQPKISIVADAAGKRGLDTIISWTLPEMDLRQALQLIADQAGINMVIGQGIKGTISCKLVDVSARSAISLILSSNGYKYIEQSGILLVIPAETGEDEIALPPARIVRKFFRLPYSGSEQDMIPSSGDISDSGGSSYETTSTTSTSEPGMAKTIRDMLSPLGKMAYYERQHVLMIADDENTVAMIDEFVKMLWEAPYQVFIDSKLVEITLEDNEAMGLTWSILADLGSHRQGVNLVPNSTGIVHPGTSALSAVTNNATLSSGATPFSFGIVNSNVEVIAQALDERERVDLRTNPRVLVSNHRRATIIVGQEIPYLSSTESGTANPVNTYEFKEVAVRLEVGPHVSADGNQIFLDVHPRVKNVIGFTGIPPQPVLSTREAVTYVSVANDSTLIIGGLVQRNIDNIRWSTPFISKIPVLGWLFKQKQRSDTKNDLIFLLNPRVLNPAALQEKLASRSDLTDELPDHIGDTSATFPGKRDYLSKSKDEKTETVDATEKTE